MKRNKKFTDYYGLMIRLLKLLTIEEDDNDDDDDDDDGK